jgi:hypothetical protein
MNIDFDQMVPADIIAAADLTAARALARQLLLGAIEAATEAVTGPVPLAEKLCWASKEAAARAVGRGDASEAERALIESEATVTGEDAGALIARIVRNADTWRSAIALLTGLRRAGDEAIDAAVDPAGVEAACGAILERLDALQAGTDA